MLETHQRAALIPIAPGVPWHSFLASRFVEPRHFAGKGASLAIVVQAIQQQGPIAAGVLGLVELFKDSALPVVSAFEGQINLESREFSIRQSEPGKSFSGQISENGLVIVLHAAGQTKPIHLVHEQTLGQLV
jgi:hypothetical protein